MLHTIQSFSQRRVSWFLLAVTAILLECFALFMQHLMGVEPCNECIYVRVAVLGMALAGLMGAIAPGVRIMRWLVRVPSSTSSTDPACRRMSSEAKTQPAVPAPTMM